MKIELWEDIVCSWCGITNGRVNEALKAFPHRDDVEFVHRSYRLMPDAPEGKAYSFREYMVEQGVPSDQVKKMAESVEQIAAADGQTPYHVLDNSVGNTTLAHEFLAWASAQGKQNEAWDLLFKAHFANQAPLWTIEDLVPFAKELGLRADDARVALVQRTFLAQVQADQAEARELGAQGVPFIVIDRKYALAGAQSVEALLSAFSQVWTQTHD